MQQHLTDNAPVRKQLDATGPSSATQAILFIYDIFGYFPQTLQGADLLAHADASHQYRVFMPDFFEGSPADISWYPPDTAEKGQKLGDFFKTTAAPPKAAKRVPELVSAIQQQHPEIKAWGVVGYCWGGKIVNLTGGQGTPFKAAAACHPAMVDPKDAAGLKIPICLIPSQGEEQKDVDAYVKDLTVPHELHWFKDQVHGFMAARSDLEDDKVKAAYQKGYEILLNFFHQHM